MTRPEPTDEREVGDGLAALVPAAVAGDRAAMRALLGGVAPVVARACRRVMGRGEAEAEDVAQQALTGFVARLPTFRGESTVAHFAERIAVYRALSARRDAGVRRRHVDVVEGGGLDDVSDASHAPDARLDERHRRSLLVSALEALPEPQAEALALHFLFDHTVAEIAGMAGVPQETVRSRLRLGKQALRALIAKDAALSALREGTS
ncbi:MAG TPA: sigma-70 family RNA polymerase sigma factor [Polyangia bacterium]|jgi:RNA polymerase sigma-70 factor (ECF subfamily)|nr:sigma-70 family RNA polymerase sigma factor [Polyangia bacterium]